ncbi:GSCOCG00004501001-RA-CDS [Cotesia congregata]|nr:GSCOCG00004501001-RA-CDS [Cotesia congregata]
MTISVSSMSIRCCNSCLRRCISLVSSPPMTLPSRSSLSITSWKTYYAVCSVKVDEA